MNGSKEMDPIRKENEKKQLFEVFSEQVETSTSKR
jgi:hypothetical protein